MSFNNQHGKPIELKRLWLSLILTNLLSIIPRKPEPRNSQQPGRLGWPALHVSRRIWRTKTVRGHHILLFSYLNQPVHFGYRTFVVPLNFKSKLKIKLVSEHFCSIKIPTCYFWETFRQLSTQELRLGRVGDAPISIGFSEPVDEQRAVARGK